MRVYLNRFTGHDQDAIRELKNKYIQKGMDAASAERRAISDLRPYRLPGNVQTMWDGKHATAADAMARPDSEMKTILRAIAKRERRMARLNVQEAS